MSILTDAKNEANEAADARVSAYLERTLVAEMELYEEMERDCGELEGSARRVLEGRYRDLEAELGGLRQRQYVEFEVEEFE